MATDLAEFIGAAIGFKLITGVSLYYRARGDTVSRRFWFPNVTTPRSKTAKKSSAVLLLFVAAAYVWSCFLSA